MQGTRVQSLGQKDPLEEGMAIHSSILAWRIRWTESQVHRVTKSRTQLKWFSTHTCMSPSSQFLNLRVVLETLDPPTYTTPVESVPLILYPSEVCSSQAVGQTFITVPGLDCLQGTCWACREPTWEHAASWGSAVLYLGVWNQPRALEKAPKGSDAQSAWESLLWRKIPPPPRASLVAQW